MRGVEVVEDVGTDAGNIQPNLAGSGEVGEDVGAALEHLVDDEGAEGGGDWRLQRDRRCRKGADDEELGAPGVVGEAVARASLDGDLGRVGLAVEGDLEAMGGVEGLGLVGDIAEPEIEGVADVLDVDVDNVVLGVGVAEEGLEASLGILEREDVTLGKDGPEVAEEAVDVVVSVADEKVAELDALEPPFRDEDRHNGQHDAVLVGGRAVVELEEQSRRTTARCAEVTLDYLDEGGADEVLVVRPPVEAEVERGLHVGVVDDAECDQVVFVWVGVAALDTLEEGRHFGLGTAVGDDGEVVVGVVMRHPLVAVVGVALASLVADVEGEVAVGCAAFRRSQRLELGPAVAVTVLAEQLTGERALPQMRELGVDDVEELAILRAGPRQGVVAVVAPPVRPRVAAGEVAHELAVGSAPDRGTGRHLGERK